MTGAVEAAGTVGEGALWARAVEPAAGEAHAAAHGGLCLNCGTALIGRYCHACGQSAHVHRTLGSLGHDLLHGVFHFEGKIWRTLPMLVLHPGRLTRRYIDGERARFVSPLALYLFTVFLMFATLSAMGPGDFSKRFATGWSTLSPQMAAERAKGVAEIARLERERAALAGAGRPVAALDRRLAEQRSDLALFDRVAGTAGPGAGAATANTGSNWFERGWRKAKENPGLTLYKVQSAAYKFSWALILLSTPLVAILFLWRRRFGLYDHAIFVTYSISFMSLLAIAMSVLVALGVRWWLVGWVVTLVPPIHMFVQLRGTYGLRWFSAAWRTVALLAFSSLALLLFVVVVALAQIGG
jgi:hypothetical protein